MPTPVTQAVVFADRNGAEFEPLFGQSCPALLPLAGKTALEYCLDDLSEAGIARVIIIVARCSSEIQQRLGDGENWGLELEYVLSRGEEAPLDILRRIGGRLDQRILALRGDILRTPSAAAALAALTEEAGVLRADGGPLGLAIAPAGHDCLSHLAWPLDPDAGEAMLAEQQVNLLANFADFHRANIELLQGRVGGQVLPGLVRQEGLRVGRLSHVASQCVANSPVTLGDHSSVHRDCKLYGPVVIGSNCFIDRGTQISNSVVLPGTYVGSGLDIKDAIVGEGCLVQPQRDLLVTLDDPLWIAPMLSAGSASDRSLVDRFLAVILLVLSAPLWLGLLWGAPAGQRLQRRVVPGNRRDIRGQRLGFGLLAGRSGCPIVDGLPGLLAVVRGDLRMIGSSVAGRIGTQGLVARISNPANEVQPPLGLVRAADLALSPGAPEEEAELFDICFAAERNGLKNLHFWGRAALRLLSPDVWRVRQPERRAPQD